jgi:hypothetical protein
LEAEKDEHMPTLVELRSRVAAEQEFYPSLATTDEVLVADVRGRLRPAQIVEQKLRSLLPKEMAIVAAIPRALRRQKAK